MNTVKNGRVRGPNFTLEEQKLLCKVTKMYSGIIECKDGVKQVQKQEAWQKIEEIFNSNTKGVPRTAENLLACYRNMKSKIKKLHSNAKMQDPVKREQLINSIDVNEKDSNAVSPEVDETSDDCESQFLEMQKYLKKKESQDKTAMRTGGGGPPPPDDENEPLNKLKKLFEPQIEIYDGDALSMAQYQESLPNSEKAKPIEYGNERLQKKDSTNAKFISLEEAKMELVQLQKQLLEKEHILKDLEIENKIKENKHREILREKELLLIEMKINNLK